MRLAGNISKAISRADSGGGGRSKKEVNRVVKFKLFYIGAR